MGGITGMLTLDRLKNVAVMAMCLVVILVAARAFLGGSPSNDAGSWEMPPPPYTAGEHIDSMPAVIGQGRTLLMVLSSTCRFCSQSMPFYREIRTAAPSNGDAPPRFVALHFPSDSNDTMKTYLESHAFQADEIVGLQRGMLDRVSGTPTLILVETDGTVIGSWRGLLNEVAEADVRRLLGS